MTNRKQTISGYTLIEIMVAVAIIAIVAAIAIPSYTGYITTSRNAAARANIEPLRLALEDFWLDNGTYDFDDLDDSGGDWTHDPDGDQDFGNLGWSPDGDDNNFVYELTVSGANAFTITVTHVDGGCREVCKPQADPCPNPCP